MSDTYRNTPNAGKLVATVQPQQLGSSVNVNPYAELIQSKHPEWKAQHTEWIKNRLVFKGGRAFIEKYLKQYIRETNARFDTRKELTHNPAHAKSVVQIVRNSIAAKLPDVDRTGSEQYLEAIKDNIDNMGNSMSTFMAEFGLPDLLVTGGSFVWVDAPPKEMNASLADDLQNKPYIYTILRENILSWSRHPVSNQLTAVLIREDQTCTNEFQLTTGFKEIYRYAFINENGFCEVWFIDKQGALIGDNVLDLKVIPLAVMTLPDSLLTDISDIQISILNDRSALQSSMWISNFPLLLENYDPAVDLRLANMAKSNHTGSKFSAADQQEIDKGNLLVIGAGQTLRYPKGTEAPKWIVPPTDGFDASMKYEEQLIQEIKVLSSLSLMSLSAKALEASGASKEMDRIGEEAALAAIAVALESGEQQIQVFWKAYENSSEVFAVAYPREYSLKTEEALRQAAAEITALSSAVQSETANKALQKKAARTLLRNDVEPKVMDTIEQEIEDAGYIDANKLRTETITDDLANQLVSKSTASTSRGYPDDEAEKAAEDREKTNASIFNVGSEGVGSATQDNEAAEPDKTELIVDDEGTEAEL